MTDELFLRYYEKYRNSVFSVIFGYVKDRDDASDISQEVFMKLFGTKQDFESEEHVKAWLIRVGINLSKNHLRDTARAGLSELDENTPAPEKEDMGDVMAAVTELPEKYRLPIHLFYYEEMSIKEIARSLGLMEATVKTRLNRGRKKLEKALRKEGGSYEYQYRI
ncbi:MAG: sigma-70 family RNA polymerase sigma factor [Ruminococcus sp.]|nr:sigma-70 family RNA polymerase sigma factor [Ruminococcus sp.]